MSVGQTLTGSRESVRRKASRPAHADGVRFPALGAYPLACASLCPSAS